MLAIYRESIFLQGSFFLEDQGRCLAFCSTSKLESEYKLTMFLSIYLTNKKILYTGGIV